MALNAGSKLGPFEILGLLGVGGMGEVYRARDSRLHREVAIKVLPEAVGRDVDRLGRFEREARLLASLDHPNIATIHDFQEDGGACFLVMQLIEGATLADRLARGPIAPGEALPLFSAVAAGLAAAHERGVVHRDLKPGNLKIDPAGRVKILDFGLAKAIAAGAEGGRSEATTLALGEVAEHQTHDGAILGTPAYMSPEQARGQATDRRTDVWAFGVCFYEALAGRRPFRGESPADLLSKILRDDPDWTALPPELPAHLRSMLRRCLEKNLSRRLSSMSDIAIMLEDAAPEWKGINQEAAAPAPAASAGRSAQGAPATPAPGSDGVPKSTPPPPGKIERLVVLPFTSIAKDASEDWFVDGMTEALITELGKIEALSVISRSSAMQFKGTKKSAPAIAMELGVDALVEGSVQRAGDEVRIQARLIDARNDRQIWASDYDGNASGILALQKEVALAIARAVAVKVTPSEARRIAASESVSPEAYEAYLRGLFFYHKQDDPGLRRSQQLFERCIELDPRFAKGHAFLAMAHIAHGLVFVGMEVARERTRRAIEQALACDPAEAMAHTVAGWFALAMEWDWSTAEREFRRGIELNPGLPDAHNGLGWFYSSLGRLEEALDPLRRAIELDPLNPSWRLWLAATLQALERYEEAQKELREVLEFNPDHLIGRIMMAGGLLELGRPGEAVEMIETDIARHGRSVNLLVSLAHLYARTDRQAGARTLATELLERADRETLQPFDLGSVLVAAGRNDEAFPWFERFVKSRGLSTFMIHGYAFRPFWGEPRFEALLDEIGYPGVRPKPKQGQPGRGDAAALAMPPRLQKLAVLPFTSIARDASEDWLVDGMTEVLITELGKIKSLTVISRTSAMRYKATDKPLPVIAKELGVDALVEGSVIRMGNDVQITARLIDGGTDKRLWGDFFSGKFEDILRLQGEVTLAIAREVKATVSPEERAQVGNASRVQSAAYEEYLRARHYESQLTPDGFRKAVAAYERVIQLDPDFAPAHAGLAIVLSDLIIWYLAPASEILPRLLSSAKRAVELDPAHPEAHAAMALALLRSNLDWRGSQAEFNRALELDPANVEVIYVYVWSLIFMGRRDDAARLLERARVLDPLSPKTRLGVGANHFFAREYEAAIARLREGLEVAPDYLVTNTYLGLALLFQGETDAALPHLRRAVEVEGATPSPFPLTHLAIGLHRSGDTAGARAILEQLLERERTSVPSWSHLAQLYGALGEIDRAMEYFERAVDAREWVAAWAPTYALWDPLRADPRFQPLVERLGLPA